MEHLAGRPEAVIGCQHDGRLGARELDDFRDQPVERAEVPVAQRDHVPLPGARMLGVAGGIDEPPAQVLELVDAVEHHSHQVGRIGLHQVAQNLGPSLLAADMEFDEVRELLVRAAVDGLDLELHVEHLARVEARDLLQPFEQPRRMAANAQLAPGHHPPGHDRPVHGRRREREREVERDDPPVLLAGEGPDRLGSHLLRAREGEVHAPRLLLLEEVEDAVLAGVLPGHQRRPGGRRQRRHDRAQDRARAARGELGQERHHAALHVRIQHGERRSVQADEQRWSHVTPPVGSVGGARTRTSRAPRR